MFSSFYRRINCPRKKKGGGGRGGRGKKRGQLPLQFSKFSMTQGGGGKKKKKRGRRGGPRVFPIPILPRAGWVGKGGKGRGEGK